MLKGNTRITNCSQDYSRFSQTNCTTNTLLVLQSRVTFDQNDPTTLRLLGSGGVSCKGDTTRLVSGFVLASHGEWISEIKDR